MHPPRRPHRADLRIGGAGITPPRLRREPRIPRVGCGGPTYGLATLRIGGAAVGRGYAPDAFRITSSRFRGEPRVPRVGRVGPTYELAALRRVGATPPTPSRSRHSA